MMFKSTLSITLLLLGQSSAFSTQGIAFAPKASTSLNAVNGRRDFVATAFAATLAVASPAFAEDAVDDLAMPTEEEQKKQSVSVPSIFKTPKP